MVLASDQEKDPDQRPTFLARVLSVREARKLMGMVEVVQKARSDAEMPFETIDELMETLEANLVGWRNITDPAGGEIGFAPGILAEVLTLPEAFEMMGLLTAQGIGAAERKKSESPSDCSTD